MDIHQYLRETKITTQELADLCMLTPKYLSKIANGQHKPSDKAAKAIIKASDGKITKEGIENPGKKFCTKCGRRHDE